MFTLPIRNGPAGTGSSTIPSFSDINVGIGVGVAVARRVGVTVKVGVAIACLVGEFQLHRVRATATALIARQITNRLIAPAVIVPLASPIHNAATT
jgi:hypothetical protein